MASNGEAAGRPDCVVVMGPSGVGKTTVAQALAARLGWAFAEADEFHPPANIAKMSAGVPLDDDDRAPWLVLIRDWIGAQAGEGASTVVTCSALKRRYRDVLRGAPARVRFLELAGDPALVEDRMSHRAGHYMPTSLLASQFAALEPLATDEAGARVDITASPQTVVDRAVAALGLERPTSAVSAAR
ncbi:gluconokinase [Methylopila musalis]|uniref:Gluconokinase n=1 Tax=Methylopila musalis TaxID=1134781 RepID=A0ABW3ZAJ4_9HYPH